MIFTKEMRDKGIKAHKENRIKDLKYQKDNKVITGKVMIQPAIGMTGGSKNIGWELISCGFDAPNWYFATKPLCEQNIARYITKYNAL